MKKTEYTDSNSLPYSSRSAAALIIACEISATQNKKIRATVRLSYVFDYESTKAMTNENDRSWLACDCHQACHSEQHDLVHTLARIRDARPCNSARNCCV